MAVLEIHTPDPRSFDDASRPFAEAVASRYAVRKLIGRGGMGLVYLARDRRLDRLVAIKTLPPQLAADSSVRERFLRETRTAGAMSHVNIVPIHGGDEIDGHVFFVMGFVDGDSLAAQIRSNGRLPAKEVARTMRDVASALVHAHGRGIIHRDIKAENILIERSTGRALVTDFGIARLAEAGPLTATGQMLGTVYYISPEQVSGDKVDARSDLYSLGVVGFFALTGRFPFEADLASAVLIAHVNRPAPPVRSVNAEVPTVLAAIVDRCLAKSPAQRFESADALLIAMEAAIADLDRTPGAIGKPRLVSDAEAQSVWQRAAELQAATGIHPRPVPIPVKRDHVRDRSRTSGFRVDDIREAAREAGITTQYIEHALIERGLTAPQAGAAPAPRRSWWAGAPLTNVEQVEVDGEINPREFDHLFSILRDGTGLVGVTTASKREMSWYCETSGQRLDVSVVPVDGKTSIRLSDTIGQFAAITMVTAMSIGAAVGPLVAIVAREIIKRPTPHWIRALDINLFISRSSINSIAGAIAVGVALTSIPVGRAIVRRRWRSSFARLRTLAEAVSANVRLAVRDRRAD